MCSRVEQYFIFIQKLKINILVSLEKIYLVQFIFARKLKFLSSKSKTPKNSTRETCRKNYGPPLYFLKRCLVLKLCCYGTNDLNQ